MMRTSWSGVYVVCVTPFTEQGTFDEPQVRRLVDVLVADGAEGIVLAGSTGEWFAMSDDERIELFRVAADQNRGRVKLLAGTSAIATPSAVRITAAAKEMKLDGALVLPPPYILPTERELLAYFEALDEVGLPIMLYNNPARTAINLDAKLLEKFLRFKSVVALKDSVKDLAQIGATLRAHGNELAIFTGIETYIVPSVQRGAVGVVAMAPNVLGAEAITLFRHAAAGRWSEASAIQAKIDLLYDWMYGAGINPYVVLKEGMRLRGRPGGHPRAPLLAMTPDERSRFATLLQSFEQSIAA